MSTYSGPNIVKNGLVLHLDAGNSKSYPGSGTAWTDLSNNNNTATLINGPIYNSANKGSIIFDGINDFCSVQNSTSLQFGETFSVNCWIYPTSISNRYGIFSTRTNNENGSWQLEVGSASIGAGSIGVSGVNTWIWASDQNVISNNSWHNICYIKPNNSSFGTIYLDSVQITPSITNSYTILNNSSAKSIGFGTYTTTQFFVGNIAQISIYNKIITQSEMLQNFNSTRGRYGI